jgi:phosphoribosyl-AMP cyclohydrolase
VFGLDFGGPSPDTVRALVALECAMKVTNMLEEGEDLNLDFGKIADVADSCPDVLPVAVQNADTGEVILVAYTNEDAFQEAMRTRKLVLWSTSRNELWIKGATSGETFELVEARVNCEQNSLLYKVRPTRGGICHTKNSRGQPRNCYYRTIDLQTYALKNTDP